MIINHKYNLENEYLSLKKKLNPFAHSVFHYDLYI